MIRIVIRDAEEFVVLCPCASATCGGCASAKRANIYFKMLKSCVGDNETFRKVSDLMLAEEDSFTHTFIMSVLSSVDEDSAMERVFDDKDSISNHQYMLYCNMLMNVKAFKNMFKHTYC